MLLLSALWQLLFLSIALGTPIRRHSGIFADFTPTLTYLVKFREDATTTEVKQHMNWLRNVSSTDVTGVELRHRFSLTFQGYSAVLDDKIVGEVFRLPEIISVEPIGASPPTEPTRFDDRAPDESSSSFSQVKIVNIEPASEDLANSQDASNNEIDQTSDVTPGPTRHNAALESVVTDESKGWNTIRLSHRDFNGGYRPGSWLHNGFLGQGTVVYVLDTGVNLQQQGFEGSVVVQPKVFVKNSGPQDLHGHGTMCAGVIAGHYSGLAPGAKLVSLKVANDDNISWADDVAAGIEWAIKDRSVRNNMKVISLSQVNFSGTPLVNTAVEAAIAEGIHVVISAGNDNVNACGVSPANAEGAITVGSINAWDALPIKGMQPAKFHRQPRPPVGTVMANPGGQKYNNPNIAETQMQATEAKEAIDFAGFDTADPEGTNWGPCITLFAPGIYVPTLSAHNTSTAYHYWGWGTSIAAPQVAALVANRLSEVGPVLPAKMKKWLVEQSTKGQMQGALRGSPNRIAFSGVREAKSNGGRTTSSDERSKPQPVVVQASPAPTMPVYQAPVIQQPPTAAQPPSSQQPAADEQPLMQQEPPAQTPAYQQAAYPQSRPAYPAAPSQSSRTRPQPSSRQDDDDERRRSRTSASVPWWLSWAMPSQAW